jgi:hypothetical protein
MSQSKWRKPGILHRRQRLRLSCAEGKCLQIGAFIPLPDFEAASPFEKCHSTKKISVEKQIDKALRTCAIFY